MEFRVFPQPKRDAGQPRRSPAFGRRETPPEDASPGASVRIAKAAALCVGVAALAYLVMEPF